MKVFIDLFSGLGGAAAAFDLSPDWKTIKIDNNEILVEHNRGLQLMDLSDVEGAKHAISLQLQQLADEGRLEKVVLWASPPCTEFSYANAARSDEPDMTLLDATLELIEHLRYVLDYWVIENVKGAIPIFNEEIGRTPTQTIGPVVLWGHFPLIPIRTRDTWVHRKMECKGSRALRPNNRALIPFPISEGLHDAIEHQKTLDNWN